MFFLNNFSFKTGPKIDIIMYKKRRQESSQYSESENRGRNEEKIYTKFGAYTSFPDV